jgi:hypothetical protein
MFWSDISPPSSGSKSKLSKKKTQYNSLNHAGVLLGLFFDSEDGGDVIPGRWFMFTGLQVFVS